MVFLVFIRYQMVSITYDNMIIECYLAVITKSVKIGNSVLNNPIYQVKLFKMIIKID